MIIDIMMLMVLVYNIGVLFIFIEVECYEEVFVSLMFFDDVIDKLVLCIGGSIM